MEKALVAYFSASGVTAKLARDLADVTGGDLFEIVPEQLYTDADLDWHNMQSRSSVEMKDSASRPAIAHGVENMNEYDTVFVGFPIWWYVAPTIINTFLESYDFSGKTVVTFATSGSSGMGDTDAVLKECCSEDTRWKTGRRFGNPSKDELAAWAAGLGL